MVDSPLLADLVTEFAVPSDVTARELSRYVAALHEQHIRLVAQTHQKMVADIERQAAHIKRSVRDAWLNKNRRAANAGDPAVIRRNLERRPPCPPDVERSDIPEVRLEPRPRGVYLRLRHNYHLAVEIWAVDTQGNAIAEATTRDDEISRLEAVRYCWSVLKRSDPIAGDAARS